MSYSRLLNCLWRAGHLSGREFTGSMGEGIVVVSVGEPSGEVCVWNSAEIVVDGERRRGQVAIGEETAVPDGAIFRLTSEKVPCVLGADDHLVPQAEYPIDRNVIALYDALRAGAASSACADRIASMPSEAHRMSLFTGLLVDRLRRKYDDIMRIFGECDQDWNQTFYTILLRVMGGDRNREAYASLASKVTCAMLSREKGSPTNLEALLLGGAGFLFAAGDKDDYTLRLEAEFRHLAAKYSIVPLKPAVWDTARLHTANFPTVRLAEIAALFAKKDFMLDGMLACRTADAIDHLFGVSASEYWDTHYKPGAQAGLSPKRIGRSKTALVAINLAAPLMFAYGRQTGAEELCDRALELLESVPAEKNGKLEGWYGRGCVAASGFESQALLQLTNEYCTPRLCADCPLGRAEIKKLL